MLAAGIGWWLSRPAELPPAVAAAPNTVPLRAGPTADPPAPIPSTPAAAAPPPNASDPPRASGLALPTTPPADDLHMVLQALDGGTPREALDAAYFLALCPHRQQIVDAMTMTRDHPEWRQAGASVQNLDADIAREQDLQRRCQYVDAAMLARTGELFWKAYEGGAPGALMAYLSWLGGAGRQEANPELLTKLQREARQSAEDGDVTMLLAYAYTWNPAPLGASPMQRQAYKEAWLRITGELSGDAAAQASRASMDSFEQTFGVRPLSPEQQREADALTKQVVDNWRKRQGKGD
jgi:hypothetical protein